jgi:hypothetical protein
MLPSLLPNATKYVFVFNPTPANRWTGDEKIERGFNLNRRGNYVFSIRKRLKFAPPSR